MLVSEAIKKHRMTAYRIKLFLLMICNITNINPFDRTYIHNYCNQIWHIYPLSISKYLWEHACSSEEHGGGWAGVFDEDETGCSLLGKLSMFLRHPFFLSDQTRCRKNRMKDERAWFPAKMAGRVRTESSSFFSLGKSCVFLRHLV
jgi:hypothetical protein